MINILIIITGLLNGIYQVMGKWQNYIFGALFSLINAYVSFKTNLYGIAILSLLLYFPLQIQGLISWHSNKNINNKVIIKRIDKKLSFLIILTCFLGSISFGLILLRIPNQSLAFLDGASNVLNICAIILMNLRYSQCWWILLGNNIIDFVIWMLKYLSSAPNSFMMLTISIIYLILNVLGIISWQNKKGR